MAKYFLLVKIFSRAKGSRVTRAAAYRAGERIREGRWLGPCRQHRRVPSPDELKSRYRQIVTLAHQLQRKDVGRDVVARKRGIVAARRLQSLDHAIKKRSADLVVGCILERHGASSVSTSARRVIEGLPGGLITDT